MPRLKLLVAGAALMVGIQAAMKHLLLTRFRSSVDALNNGDYGPLLDSFADDAVLHFTEGEHRWAGDHRGRAEIETFLRNFVGAGLKGEIRELWTSGPPWALTAVVRFDDWSFGEDGQELYSNQTMLMVRTRWGKVIEQHDYYLDTARIPEFDRKLNELGIKPAN